MKRKCGTCKYFEDRGVAGSGVCLHPQRRELRDVVLVRQTELACRNSWDQDLWEESPNPVLNPALVTTPGDERDIVYDSVPANVERDEPVHQESDQIIEDSPLPGSVPERSVFGSPVPPSIQVNRPLLGIAGRMDETTALNDDYPADSLRHSTVYEARKRLDEERRRARMREQEKRAAEIGRGAAVTETLPESPSVVRPPVPFASPPRERTIPIAGLHEFPDDEPVSLRVDGAPSPGVPTTKQPASDFRPTVTTAAVENSVPDPAGLEKTEQLPTRQVREALALDSLQATPPTSSQVGLPVDATVREPFVHIDGNIPQVTQPPSVPAQSSEIALPQQDDPIDRDTRLAAIPRCCGTCRDFRQVGDGGSGQCVNPYAFGDRRMVKSDQLACRSSLGTWWMPNDDFWLERADTSHHGRPTPLLDATIRAQREGDSGRDSHA